MKPTDTKIEAILSRSIGKYNLEQVESALNEIGDILSRFRKFDFKKEGLQMTALEFFQIKNKLFGAKKVLKKRRAEILKNRKCPKAVETWKQNHVVEKIR